MPAQAALAYQKLWMAAVTRLPMPASLADAWPLGSGDTLLPLAGKQALVLDAAGEPAGATARPAQASPRRWSTDGWFLGRRGRGKLAAGSTPASYGASQLGAVLRYRLDTSDPSRPALFVRATAALNGSGERQVALGHSSRLFPRVPVTVQQEIRLVQISGRSHFRPAVLVVTEFPPLGLGSRGRVEAYGQAGYVWGGKDRTAFADGQLRADYRLFGLGRGELRAGAAAWAGAQKGASRVDVGPSVAFSGPLGKGFMRAGADWRFRVAGNATPDSGPAVTLSAGF